MEISNIEDLKLLHKVIGNLIKEEEVLSLKGTMEVLLKGGKITCSNWDDNEYIFLSEDGECLMDESYIPYDDCITDLCEPIEYKG